MFVSHPYHVFDGSLGIDHPQGPGKLVHIDCEVIFHVFVPNDLEETPYIHFTSHGTHSHAPPPPNKPPMQILNEVLELVRRISNPELALGKIIQTGLERVPHIFLTYL